MTARNRGDRAMAVGLLAIDLRIGPSGGELCQRLLLRDGSSPDALRLSLPRPLLRTGDLAVPWTVGEVRGAELEDSPTEREGEEALVVRLPRALEAEESALVEVKSTLGDPQGADVADRLRARGQLAVRTPWPVALLGLHVDLAGAEGLLAVTRSWTPATGADRDRESEGREIVEVGPPRRCGAGPT